MTATERLTRVASLRFCLAAVAALALLGAADGSAARAADAADPFEVEVRDTHGRRVRLADFKGKILMVDLWASWCATCKISFAALDALHRDYHPRGVEIVAVNLDERRKDAEAFLVGQPSRMLVAFDPRARLLRAFGAPGVPSSYLIDRQGTIRYRHGGYTAGTDAEYRQQLDTLLAETTKIQQGTPGGS